MDPYRERREARCLTGTTAPGGGGFDEGGAGTGLAAPRGRSPGTRSTSRPGDSFAVDPPVIRWSAGPGGDTRSSFALRAKALADPDCPTHKRLRELHRPVTSRAA